MIESLTLRQRRLLALSILAAFAVIAYAAVVAPLRTLHQNQIDTIERLETRLAVLRRSSAADADLRDRHARLQQAAAANHQQLQSKSEALAAADLQRIVKRTATAKTTELLSTQILPAREEAGFTRIALKVRLRGSLANLVKVLHTLETGQPYLFLDNLSARKRGVQRYKSGADDQMDIDFDLIGYMPPQP